MCLGSLLCWKVNLFLAPFIFLPALTCFPGTAEVQHASMTLPPPCSTVRTLAFVAMFYTQDKTFIFSTQAVLLNGLSRG